MLVSYCFLWYSQSNQLTTFLGDNYPDSTKADGYPSFDDVHFRSDVNNPRLIDVQNILDARCTSIVCPFCTQKVSSKVAVPWISIVHIKPKMDIWWTTSCAIWIGHQNVVYSMYSSCAQKSISNAKSVVPSLSGHNVQKRYFYWTVED